MTTPVRPSCPRSMPVTIGFDSDAGCCGSRLASKMWAVRTASAACAEGRRLGPRRRVPQGERGGAPRCFDATLASRLHRFVHVSTLGVYEARHHYGTDETEPLPDKHIDGYTQSKVEAERLALQYHRKQGVPVMILRPGFVYGPRDRTVLPRLVDRLRERSVIYIARGKYAPTPRSWATLPTPW